MTPKRILRIRKVLELTQQQLADEIGAFRETIARWELGSNQPRGANLKALIKLEEKSKKKERSSNG